MSEIILPFGDEPGGLTADDLATILTDKQTARIFREHGVKYMTPAPGEPQGTLIAEETDGNWIAVTGWSLQRVREWLGY